MSGTKIKIDVGYLADMCEDDLGYSINTPFYKNTRYAYARTQSDRRNKSIVEQFVDGVRVGTYDAPYAIEIFD